MEHRSVLALGGLVVLVLLTGCSAAGSLDMEPATDDRLAEEASHPVPETTDEPIERGKVIRAAIENGSATVQSQEPLITAELPFRSDGHYYNISSTVIERQPGTEYRFGIDYNGTAENSRTVSYENLSARDRQILDHGLPPKAVTSEPGSDYYIDGTYTASGRNQSVLLAADTDAVRYEGDIYPIEVTDTDAVTIPTRRYTATVVATSTATYATHLRSEYLFGLTGLSSAEQSVVTEAINDTYYAESDSDEAFEGVLERFSREAAIEQNEFRGLWLVRYNGEIYIAQLSYEGFEMA